MGRRRDRSPIRVERGERLLADAVAEGAHLGGTRDAFYVVRRLGVGTSDLTETVRVPWEDVEAAAWERDTSELVLTEVGSWGEVRPEHRFVLAEPGRLMELVRERITASVVLQRHVPVVGRRGVRVIARRAPRGDQPLRWLYQYDDGVDPSDPAVQEAAAEALAAARADVGAL